MKLSLAAIAVVATFLLAADSQAQGGFASAEMNRIQSVGNAATFSADRIRTRAVAAAAPQFAVAGVNPGVVGANALGRPKPFSSISKGPSVTPYLALDNPFTSPATSYYTQIRPQLDQQRVNDQLQRQSQQMQRALSQYTSRPPYAPTGNENMAPTGHAAVYQNLGGYYTVAPARKR